MHPPALADAVTQRDRVEGQGNTTHRPDACFDCFSYLIEMRVTRDQLTGGVRDPNQRGSLNSLHPKCMVQAASIGASKVLLVSHSTPYIE